MKHVHCVSRLPLSAASSPDTSGVDIGGIIKGVGGAVASIIVAVGIVTVGKSLLGEIQPLTARAGE